MARDLLRFVVCGSVDDGKSTLMGRLLRELGEVPEDRLEDDDALLLDGLAAEREQGITIDVAWRSFETAGRRFIAGDAPGHEQYTRNMATAASRAGAALILVDATRGVRPQTFRHACIAALMGVRHILFAVNKMDAVGWSAEDFDAIAGECAGIAARLGVEDAAAVPVSATEGGNLVARSDRVDWYRGPSVLEWLENVPVEEEAEDAPFRMPVQRVTRAGGERLLAGTVASGRVAAGDEVLVQPAGTRARIARVEGTGAVQIVLEGDVDCSRGDVLAGAEAPLEVADQFQATIVWLAAEPMLPGRLYGLKLGTASVTASVTELKYEWNVETLEHLAAATLGMNAIGVATLSLSAPLPIAPYAGNKAMGGFILIDRESGATLGAGMIAFALRRSHNVRWQALDVDRRARAARLGQRPRLLWFTGLSGAGKSTIANLVERRLQAEGRHTYLLDGDNLRHGLSRDLGFTDADRVENIRRAGEVARLMVDAGLIVLAAFISPFRADRAMVREMLGAGDFVEIFVDVPLDVAEARDPKGLYKRARAGEIANFTGIGSPYEAPEEAEVVIDAAGLSPEEAVEKIMGWLGRN